MHLIDLWAQGFRNYRQLDLQFPSQGLTVITGGNGQGKTNLLEAIGFVCNLRSFRGAVPETMISHGADHAVVRGRGFRDERELLVEAQLAVQGRTRVMQNRQPLRRDTEERLVATVFSPDDLALVKGAPADRRNYCDQLLADTDRRRHAIQQDFERVLRQRNALLRQAKGRLTAEIASTLDVWDERLAVLGEELTGARRMLLEELAPFVTNTYMELAGDNERLSTVELLLVAPWSNPGHPGGPGGLAGAGGGLAGALEQNRQADINRGATTVGPHRDEILLTINGFPARTHASQGEQRTLALTLRLAAHRFLTQITSSTPLLLLDDVFSELDETRARALLDRLSDGQAFLTTTADLPVGAIPNAHVKVSAGEAVVS